MRVFYSSRNSIKTYRQVDYDRRDSGGCWCGRCGRGSKEIETEHDRVRLGYYCMSQFTYGSGQDFQQECGK